MLGEVVLHDVPRVEVDFHPVALEAVHELVHFLRAVQKAVGKDVFHVQVDVVFLRRRNQRLDRGSRPLGDTARNHCPSPTRPAISCTAPATITMTPSDS